MLNIFLSYVVILPAALICYFPMKMQLKRSSLQTFLIVSLSLSAFIAAQTFLTRFLDLKENDTLMPFLIVSFLGYHASLRLPLKKTIAAFSVVIALMSILANIAVYLGDLYGAAPGMSNYSANVSLCQFVLYSLSALILACPFHKYGKLIIDQPSDSKGWYAITLFSVMLLIISISLRSIEYRLLEESQLLRAIMIVIIAQLFVWMLMLVIFYFAISDTMKNIRMEERSKMLEMQENQYLAQQRYIRESEKTRHDFMHNVRTMAELYDSGDNEALGRYLHSYVRTMPTSEVKLYCGNIAVNALLNYYEHIAMENGIDLMLQVSLPGTLPLSDVDLCIITGNILENAVFACRNEEEGFIRLSIRAEDGIQLYIVSVNSFDGVVRKSGDRYLSTNRRGEGIGLSSIMSTVENLGGVARFFHEGNCFYYNIAIPL